MTDGSFKEQILFPRIARQYRQMVVIGADVLDEGYGAERSIASLRNITTANSMGIPTRIFGFSVNGPPSEPLKQRLSKLGESTQLFVRDPASYARLKSANIPGIRRSGDLAFLLEPAGFDDLDADVKSFIHRYRGRVIGLNLTQVVMDLFGDQDRRISMIAEACKRLAADQKFGILLIPHDEPEGVEYLAKFQKKLGENHSNFSHLISPLPHCSHLKAIAGQCTHVFTCRLHLGIAALGMQRPITGFPYQGKFEGQIELFGLTQDSLIPEHKFPRNADDFYQLMKKRIECSETLSEQISEHLPTVQSLSMNNFSGLEVMDPS